MGDATFFPYCGWFEFGFEIINGLDTVEIIDIEEGSLECFISQYLFEWIFFRVKVAGINEHGYLTGYFSCLILIIFSLMENHIFGIWVG
jgi:hypothetical protein